MWLQVPPSLAHVGKIVLSWAVHQEQWFVEELGCLDLTSNNPPLEKKIIVQELQAIAPYVYAHNGKKGYNPMTD